MNSTSTTTAAPPSYTEEKASQLYPPEKPVEYDDDDNDTSSAFPSFSSPSTSRYSIKYSDLLARHGTVSDAASGQAIYTTHHTHRNPAFTLNSTSGARLATADTSTFSTRMQLALPSHGAAFELTPTHTLSSDVHFTSPAFGNAPMTWRHGRSWVRVEYVLHDERTAQAVARFRGGACWKCLPWGDFGFVETVEGLTEAQRVEVLAAGLALAYRAAVNRTATVAPAVVVS